MKRLIFITAIFMAATTGANAKTSSCVSCHISSDYSPDTTVAANYLDADIHHQNGIGCEDCHGGDPTKGFEEGDPSLAMDPAKGYKAPPQKAEIPAFCASCHANIEFMKRYNPALPTNQLELYKTSIHGKRLLGTGDTKVAACTDCHGAHGILPASDSRSRVYFRNVPYVCEGCHSDVSYMKGYQYEGKPIPTDQFAEYSGSVHGKLVLEKGDQSAPACNDCHGNHGATPPTLASVSAACGECHATNRDYFNSSPHKVPWAELGYPECEQCHGNHHIVTASDTLIGITDDALCINCHDPGTGGYAAAAKMRADIDSLKDAIDTAEALVKEAEVKGVMGGQARFDLGPAKDNLTRARTVIHTFDPTQVNELTASGIETANSVKQTAKAALGDIRIRQIGLAMALVLVLFVTFALWRKIKKVDSETDFEVKK